jgi:DNA-binding MarR family transcriptional regulator
VIARHGRCRVYDIAEELSMTVGGTSKLIDRIEAAGHCTRTPNRADRRSSIIELSPAGQQLLAGATAPFEDELRKQLGTAMIAAIQSGRPRPLIGTLDLRDRLHADADDTDHEGHNR